MVCIEVPEHQATGRNPLSPLRTAWLDHPRGHAEPTSPHFADRTTGGSSSCAKRGSICDYEVGPASSTEREPAPGLRNIKPKISYSILPVDDFVGYPLQMTSESRHLFSICEWATRALGGVLC